MALQDLHRYYPSDVDTGREVRSMPRSSPSATRGFPLAGQFPTQVEWRGAVRVARALRGQRWIYPIADSTPNVTHSGSEQRSSLSEEPDSFRLWTFGRFWVAPPTSHTTFGIRRGETSQRKNISSVPAVNSRRSCPPDIECAAAVLP